MESKIHNCLFSRWSPLAASSDVSSAVFSCGPAGASSVAASATCLSTSSVAASAGPSVAQQMFLQLRPQQNASVSAGASSVAASAGASSVGPAGLLVQQALLQLAQQAHFLRPRRCAGVFSQQFF